VRGIEGCEDGVRLSFAGLAHGLDVILGIGGHDALYFFPGPILRVAFNENNL
jgi:hypothetical protein